MDIQEPLKDPKRRSNWSGRVDTEPLRVPEKINSTLKREAFCCLRTANEPTGSQTSSSSVWRYQQWFSSSLRDQFASQQSLWDGDVLLVDPSSVLQEGASMLRLKLPSHLCTLARTQAQRRQT